jgi:hypothetical protein
MDILQLLMVVVVFVLAGGVKGVTGMGLPTVAVSLLGQWMPPVQAAALLVIPSLATNIAQCRGPHLRSPVSRLWPGWLAIAIVTVSAPGLVWRELPPMLRIEFIHVTRHMNLEASQIITLIRTNPISGFEGQPVLLASIFNAARNRGQDIAIWRAP